MSDLSTPGRVAAALITAFALASSGALLLLALFSQALASAPLTASQWVYFFHVAAGAPALGVYGFWAAPGAFLPRFGRGSAVIAAEAAGLILAGILALLAFPAYPLLGPHEAIAALTTAPAILAPAAVLGLAIGARGAAFGAGFLALGSLGLYLVAVDELDACRPIAAPALHRAEWNDIAGRLVLSIGGELSAEQAQDLAACLEAPPIEPSRVPNRDASRFWRDEPPTRQWLRQEGDLETEGSGCTWIVQHFDPGWVQASRECGWL